MQNPLLGRPDWTYVSVVRGPVRGPQPRLAQGTGRTGKPASPGTGAQLPAYVSDNDYRASPFSYQPVTRESFTTFVPRMIPVGNDGREIVGTYKAHDFIPAQRFFHQTRRSANWQIMTFPVPYRDIIRRQQVPIYRVQSRTIAAQPLAKSNYFLGYTIQSEIQGQIGQNMLGYMGSA